MARFSQPGVRHLRGICFKMRNGDSIDVQMLGLIYGLDTPLKIYSLRFVWGLAKYY